MSEGWTGLPVVPRVVAVSVPGLVLAGAGVTHPMVLSPSTAHHWWTLHVVLLPVFPLLGVVLWGLLRGEHGTVAWVARVAAYVYAVYYTGLDTLAGIAAGVAVDTDPHGTAVARLLLIGNQLAVPGVWAYLIAAVLTGVVSVRRDGSSALPGALIIVAAAIPFMLAHIYWPVGVMAMVGTAIGAAALETARRSPRGRVAKAPETPETTAA